MTSLFRSIAAVLTLVGVASHAAAAERTVSFTTLNLRWYGLGGTPSGDTNNETRDPSIRRHLDRHHLLTDVIALEEIVDVARVQRLLGATYQCQSYDNDEPLHQHVVVCVKQPLRLIPADDDNFTLEDVALDRYRPAVHGWVADGAGQKLAHLVAVHLKAMPDMSETRLTQIGLIGDALARMDRGLPTLITGDFNTYRDDPTLMQRRLAQRGLNLREVEVADQYTFRNGSHRNKFDRVFASGLAFATEPHVVGPCNGSPSRDEVERYYDEVSDHCAVTWSIRVADQDRAQQ